MDFVTCHFRGVVPDAERAPVFAMCKGDPQGPKRSKSQGFFINWGKPFGKKSM